MILVDAGPGAKAAYTAARLPQREWTREGPGQFDQDERHRVVAAAPDALPRAPQVGLRQSICEAHERATIAIAKQRRQVIRHVPLAVAVDLVAKRALVPAMPMPHPRGRLIG